MATQPDATNPWFGIDANISKDFTSTQQATDYWKTATIAPPSTTTPVSTSTLSSGSLNYPTGAQPQTGTGLVGASATAVASPTPVTASSTPSLDQATGSTPPAGATLISGPSGLKGLTEQQIWRDPTSKNIYRLSAPGTTATTAPATGSTPTSPTDSSALGDYSIDPAYKAAQDKQAGLEADLKAAQAGLPSQYDTFKNEMEVQGANQAKADMLAAQSKYDALMADYNNTAAAYGLQIAQNEQHAMQNGVPAVFYQGEGGAMQRTQAAILNQKATLIGAQATMMARAQQNYELAEHLAEKTADLKFADAQQKIDNVKAFLDLNKENLTRAETLARSKMEAQATERQRILDIQKENYREALAQGITTRYVNRNGKFYRTLDGKEYNSEAEFFADAGVKTFAEAYKKGLVSDITGDSIADRELVAQMAAKYRDAGIKSGDTVEVATRKMENSLTYRKETYNSDLYKDMGAPDVVDINGVDSIWNPMTGKFEPVEGSSQTGNFTAIKSKITDLSTLLNHPQLDAAVGPTAFNRVTINIGGKQEFLGKAQELISKEALDSLIAAKAKGATFGALSDREMSILQSAATTLGSWAIWNKDKTQITGFQIDEASFKRELEKLTTASKNVYAMGMLEQQGFDVPFAEAVKKAGGIDSLIQRLEADSGGFSGVGGDTNGATRKIVAVPDGVKGGQCGRFVNNLTGLGVGDSYYSKLSKMDPRITRPEPGMVFTMPYGRTGHIGFIVGIQGDQAIVKDSNYFINSNPERVYTHLIPISQMTGFRRV